MYRSMKFARIVTIIAVLPVLVVSQMVAAQSTHVEPAVPQWVIDRQQYETTFVYVQPAEVVPQWVINRQQYETTFVYVQPQAGDALPAEVALQSP